MTARVVRVVALEISRYHVGWREPRSIVDHTTVLRALLFVSYLTNSKVCAELIANGSLEASALLPTLKTDRGEYRLLSPFPRIPCLGKGSRIRRLFSTLSAVQEIIKFVRDCQSGKGTPIVVGIGEDDTLKLECAGSEKKVEPPVLRVKGAVVCTKAEESDIDKESIPTAFFRIVSEHRNVIDRVSNAADVFVLYGVEPHTYLWLALRGSVEAVNCGVSLLEILQHMGIGGFRSRGWGRFRIVDGFKPSNEDLKILDEYTGWAKGINYLLGGFPPGAWLDNRLSYASRYIMMGRAGPANNEYILPALEVMDVGSLVYNNKEPAPSPFVMSIDKHALLIFNPVVIHG